MAFFLLTLGISYFQTRVGTNSRKLDLERNCNNIGIKIERHENKIELTIEKHKKTASNSSTDKTELLLDRRQENMSHLIRAWIRWSYS